MQFQWVWDASSKKKHAKSQLKISGDHSITFPLQNPYLLLHSFFEKKKSKKEKGKKQKKEGKSISPFLVANKQHHTGSHSKDKSIFIQNYTKFVIAVFYTINYGSFVPGVPHHL
jgi:hypothetical protein